jgi:microcystin-dependent protein
MIVTNQTDSDYWFGPLHLPAGVNQQITVDDTSATSLYLTDDAVADAINNLAAAGKITVSGEAQPFPRPTGVPSLLHGDGVPEGLVYAPQGSIYARRDGKQENGGVLYLKTTGITSNTGWIDLATASGATAALPPGTLTAFGGSTAPAGWLICDGSAISRTTYSLLFAVISTAYGSGDGSTTFNLPDLRGRVAVGYAGSGGHIDVSALGNNDGQATANRRPKHRTSNNLSASITYSGPTSSGQATTATDGSTGRIVVSGNGGSSAGLGVSLGGSIGTNNANDAPDTPSYIVVNHIIKT